MSKFVVILVISMSIFLSACSGLNRQDLRQINSITSLNNNVSIKRQRHFVISPASTVALQVTLSPSISDSKAEISDSRQLILNSFKQHFQRVELFEISDSIGNDFDFIVTVNLLNVVTSPQQLDDIEGDVDKTQSLNAVAAADTAVMTTDGVIKNSFSLNGSNNIGALDGDIEKKQERRAVDNVAENSAEKRVNRAQVSLVEGDMGTAEPVTKTSLTPLQVLMKLSLVDARSNRLIDVALIDAYSSSIRKPSYDNFLMDTINRYANKITTI
ncbi:MAG: hypothetical protein ACJA1S_000030 [Cellvibrionaceae bacterium]|jgi:hypothetical protein